MAGSPARGTENAHIPVPDFSQLRSRSLTEVYEHVSSLMNHSDTDQAQMDMFRFSRQAQPPDLQSCEKISLGKTPLMEGSLSVYFTNTGLLGFQTGPYMDHPHYEEGLSPVVWVEAERFGFTPEREQEFKHDLETLKCAIGEA
jgi:hypothetical protein